MKRVIAFAALFFLLSASSPAVSVEASVDSIRAIAIPVPDENGYGVLRNICTASAIGDGSRWLSAAHCVSDPRFHYYINGEQVQVVKHDDKNDLVVLATRRTRGKPLVLAQVSPRVGQAILILGHPLGYEDLFQSSGQVIAILNLENPEGLTREFLIFQAVGAPGNSGSPVLNMRGEIVSVVQIGWSRTFSPVMGGVNYEVLVKFVRSALQ